VNRYVNALLFGIVFIMAALFRSPLAFAQAIPPYINYQGRLTNQASGAPVNGVKTITFSLYSGDKDKTPIYQQTQQVSVTNGAFSVYLGKGEGNYQGSKVSEGIPAEVFTKYSARYLGIKIADSPAEMSPRQLIASVGYAYVSEKAKEAEKATEAERAKEADKAIEADRARIAESVMGQITVDASAGNVGIGTTNPSAKLEVAGTIKSTSGGFAFPDGSVQTTAAMPSWSQKIPGPERFKLVLDGAAVLDRETGLVWERSPDAIARSWDGACIYCNDKEIGGRKGWRFPTAEELASLLDMSAGSSPYLPSGHPFSNVQSAYYWSATAYATDSSLTWAVEFHNGHVVPTHKSGNNEYVWCVRRAGL
jgi:hypothetical protein